MQLILWYYQEEEKVHVSGAIIYIETGFACFKMFLLFILAIKGSVPDLLSMKVIGKSQQSLFWAECKVSKAYARLQ